MHSIDVILCSFKRPDYLKQQVEAVQNQTVKPRKITAWRNDNLDDSSFHAMNLPFVKASSNMGVWPRFVLAMMSDADFVAVFDDDTIPGRLWFETCIEHIQKQDGLYGTHGAIFPDVENYYSFQLHGWKRPNRRLVEVDVIGHAWFFRPRNISTYLEVSPDKLICGEDMNLSFAIQKAGLKSWIVPHLPGQPEKWGAASSHNNDGRGINKNRALKPAFNAELKRIRDAGWSLIHDR